LEPKPGDDIYTTVDKNLQSILAGKLLDGLREYKAVSATGIIMDPKTGKIMALANVPEFDPNSYFKEPDGTVFGNKAISYPYEIGSVGKVFTLSAALDLETIEADSVILPAGHQGCEIINPDPPKDAQCFSKDPEKKVDCICTYDRKPNPQTLSAAQSLINSDNIAFRHIALTMTYEEFYRYLKRFGVGRGTSIELAGESSGIITDLEDWNYADQAVFSYGHSYQMTPLQVISGVAGVANEGKVMQPYIVSKVVGSDGKETVFNPRIVEEAVRPITAETVTQIMHEVYRNALIEREYKDLSRYYIALKSGTALIPYTDRPGYSDEINTTYIGFDASPEKKFIMLIKLEKPEIGELSTNNARKLWLDTFIAIKDYLSVKSYDR
jgi:cell division protein FtsI/penicillin-binding protein 2